MTTFWACREWRAEKPCRCRRASIGSCHGRQRVERPHRRSKEELRQKTLEKALKVLWQRLSSCVVSECTGRVVLLSFALAVVEVTNGSAWLRRCARSWVG